jgi:hypothetical protein
MTPQQLVFRTLSYWQMLQFLPRRRARKSYSALEYGLETRAAEQTELGLAIESTLTSCVASELFVSFPPADIVDALVMRYYSRRITLTALLKHFSVQVCIADHCFIACHTIDSRCVSLATDRTLLPLLHQSKLHM